MWRVYFTEKRAWSVYLWTSVKRDLPPEMYVTRDFFFFVQWKPQDLPEILHTRGEIRIFAFNIYDAWFFFIRAWNGIRKLLPSGSFVTLLSILGRMHGQRLCLAFDLFLLLERNAKMTLIRTRRKTLIWFLLAVRPCGGTLLCWCCVNLL